MPVRSSTAGQDRDQQFLDSIDCRLSPEAVGLRVEEIEAQRAREMVTGALESSPGASRGRKRQKKLANPLPPDTTLEKAFAKDKHARMVADALSHEAMTCFRLSGPSAEYSLLSPMNVNVFPGFRNLGNTCWLTATLQCLLHTAPLRTHLLRERGWAL